MKKIICLILAMTMISSSSFAASSPDHTKMIRKSFNEFYYQMTVMTDAKDTAAQNMATARFKLQLAELGKQGVTGAEIAEYLHNSVLDPIARQELDRVMASLPANISPQEASELSMQYLSQHYQHGASYAGSAIVASIAITLIVSAIISYLIIQANGGFDDQCDTFICFNF